MTHIKIHDFLGGVFTLQNRVRKNVGAHGGKGPPWGPQWGPMGTPMGPHGGPHGGPNISTMGDFSPMGAPISNDGGSNMPMGEINGHLDVSCTVLPCKASIPMDYPHGGLRNTHIR